MLLVGVPLAHLVLHPALLCTTLAHGANHCDRAGVHRQPLKDDLHIKHQEMQLCSYLTAPRSTGSSAAVQHTCARIEMEGPAFRPANFQMSSPRGVSSFMGPADRLP
jgi:hypothetical protein